MSLARKKDVALIVAARWWCEAASSGVVVCEEQEVCGARWVAPFSEVS